VIYLIIQVPIMIILALFISVLLNDKALKFKGFFRTAIFLPCVTSLVAYSVTFKYLFGQDGIVNIMLMKLALISEPVQWLTDPFWAKITIIAAITWRWTGYNMIFYLSALQNVDQSIYEAAKIDGASPIQTFFKITVPMLKPIILFTSITSTIGTLQLFDEVMNITAGGPGNATMTISQYIYNLSFKYTPDFGYAATVSYAIVILIVIFSIIQFKVAGDKNA
jgi:lactose/L-arabinose transport system permease protein